LAIAEPLVLVVVETRVARAVAVVREHGDLPLDAHGGARDERHAACDTGAIHGEASREVVGAVEHDVDLADGGLERSAIEALGERDDFDAGIHRDQPSLRRLDLQRADVLERIEDLPRQVRFVDAIEVVQHEPADAARREIERRGTAEPAQADDEHAGAAKLRLTFGADVSERDLPRVPLAHGAPPRSSSSTRGRPARSS